MGKFIPDRKVLAGGLAGIVAWAVMLGLSYANVTIPADTQTALVGAIGWLIAYLVPAADRDIVSKINNTLVQMAADDPTNPTNIVPPSPTK